MKTFFKDLAQLKGLYSIYLVILIAIALVMMFIFIR